MPIEPARWPKRWQKRLRALFRTHAVDRELDEELAFHLEMEIAKNVRSGLPPDEANRQARLAFGATHKHRAETREARWLSWFPDLSLDFKLGARMLVKYPGLTLVGGLAMAFGIWVGAVTFEMVTMLYRPTLPIAGGERVVAIRNWDVEESRAELKSLHDFLVWQRTLRTVTDLGAYRDITRNLIVMAGDARPVQAAEITANAFRIASEPPLLGRTLADADERNGAPLVAVIGHELWRTRFASDSSVIGRSVQIGDAYVTVVGVMPKRFAFPVSHELWLPLRLEGLDQGPRAGPAINVFGRLAPGVSLEEAQTEIRAIGQRTAREFRATHEHLQPQVLAFAKAYTPSPTASDNVMFLAIPGFAVMLLVLVCGNVALLMFARAATREGEMIVRSALGASRARIIVQMFAEALTLGGVAAAVGLTAAGFVLRRLGGTYLEVNMGRLPFWYDPHLSLATIIYAFGLTLLAAAIAGVLPALKVTRGLGSRLREAGAGGGGLKFGGIWTGVIVAQIAVTTAFPAIAYIEQQQLVRIQTFDAGFPSERYLSVFVEPELVDADVSGSSPNAVAARKAISDRFVQALETMRQRVATQPGVVGVTFVDRLPREGHHEYLVEVDDSRAVARGGTTGANASAELPETSIASVDRGYFDVLGAPILAGRRFGEADFIADPRVVIVDQAFVEQVLEGRNAIGRRIRFVDRWTRMRGEVDTTQSWREIVGVVRELGMGSPLQRGRASGVYIPVTPGTEGGTNMVVQAAGDPMSLVPEIRALATVVDPTLRLSSFQRVDRVTNDMLWFIGLWLRITVLLTAIALLLSLAGIYAVMSFTVARRTREIGIRVALGASARRVVGAIFRRPLGQIGVGVALGTALAGFVFIMLSSCQDGVCDEGAVTASRVALLLAYALVVLVVCLLACVVPTRRALAVEPVEALRSE